MDPSAGVLRSARPAGQEDGCARRPKKTASTAHSSPHRPHFTHLLRPAPFCVKCLAGLINVNWHQPELALFASCWYRVYGRFTEAKNFRGSRSLDPRAVHVSASPRVARFVPVSRAVPCQSHARISPIPPVCHALYDQHKATRLLVPVHVRLLAVQRQPCPTIRDLGDESL